MLDSITPLVASAVALAIPLMLAALGELVVERSGVLNLGLEGMMLLGALAGFAAVAHGAGLGPAVLAAIAAGIIAAVSSGFITLTLQANQVAAGLSLTCLGAGVSVCLGGQYVGFAPPVSCGDLPIPLLSRIPLLGPSLFSLNLLGYATLVLLGATAWFLYRTRAGLALRSIGESPVVARSLGLHVNRVRYAAVAFGGAMAGLAGCYYAVGQFKMWQEGRNSGQGGIGVARVDDGGWTYAHDVGRKAVEKKFGDKVQTSFVENVPEGADAERVIRELAAKGNKIVFTTSFGYMEQTLKVAKQFPKVEFYHATGFKSAPNVTIYNSRMYEPAYLAGIIAGHVSKKGVLGFVASFPIPEVARNINAFTIGARTVNPKITTKVVWVSTWFDPSKERQAAETLIVQGADVLLQNTDSSAVLQTAQDKGVNAFGWDSDMTAYAPNAHLASAIEIWGPYYIKVAEAYLAGKPFKENIWW